MSKFNTGDTVIYHGRTMTGGEDPSDRNGSFGYVIGVTAGYTSDNRAYDVNWFTGRMAELQGRAFHQNGRYAVWTRCLDLAMIKYNPDQTGDREDDI